MKKLICIFFLLFSSNCLAFEIEKIVQKDITYDGKPEKIVYKVWGESWANIDWSFTIYDEANIIYQAKTDEDYWLLTEDRGDWQGCSIKADCIKKMYGPDLINRAFHDFSADDEGDNNLLGHFKIYGVQWYQLKFNISEKVAQEYTNRLFEYLSGKDIICFSIPCYHYDGLLIYDKFLKNFVTYYVP